MSHLIPRKALFGNPTRVSPSLSPDGRHIAYLAPRDGVMNVWVAPLSALGEARPLTDERLRPIQTFFWSPASDRVLYMADVGGAEDFLLYGAPLGGGPALAYTPFPKTRVQMIKVSPEVQGAILVGLNNRDPRWHDAYRLDLASGELTLLWQNPGDYDRVIADRQLNLLLAQKPDSQGGYAIEAFGDDGDLTPLLGVGFEDGLTTNLMAFNSAGGVYLLDSRGRDKAALCLLDPATGDLQVLAEDPRSDIQGVMSDPRTGEVVGAAGNYLTTEWRAISPAVEADIDFLNERAPGAWQRVSHTDDDRLWTIQIDPVTKPLAYYLYDRETKALTLLFTARPELEHETLAAMHPVEIPASDGLTLVSYLTLPAGEDGDRPAAPLPMVLSVHGGPWGRDVYGFNPTHQWLADRGFAVLSVNYRASTGFGKAFVSAGDLQRERVIHDDLIDAVEWAVREGVADRTKVAIMGGSWGGYATLAGLAFNPDVFACGVDIVGPSNLVTLLQTIPPYWQAIFHQFAHRLGDPRTEEGRALLTSRSPVARADQIRRPLLIGQGANDPRVKQAESDQIVTALKAKNIPVTYVLYPDEGHGFARPENRLSFYAIAEAFLAQVLGGAYEPIGDDFDGSSLQVLEGAAHVAGMPASAVAG